MYVNQKNDKTIGFLHHVHVLQPLAYVISPNTHSPEACCEKEKGNSTFHILIPKPPTSLQLGTFKNKNISPRDDLPVFRIWD